MICNPGQVFGKTRSVLQIFKFYHIQDEEVVSSGMKCSFFPGILSEVAATVQEVF